MRGAERPLSYLSGRPSGAPRGDASAPRPAYRLFRGRRSCAGRYGPRPSSLGGGGEPARGGPLLRPQRAETFGGRLQVARAVILERRTRLRDVRTVLATHPSWSRDGRSLTELRRTGISDEHFFMLVMAGPAPAVHDFRFLIPASDSRSALQSDEVAAV